MLIDVRESTRYVCDHNKHVSINKRHIDRLARNLIDIEIPSWNREHHYIDSVERTLRYVFLVDSLNFCFFPEPRWKVVVKGKKIQGYFALTTVLKQAFVRSDELIENPSLLASVNEQEVRRLLQGQRPIGEIPLLSERTEILKEIGRKLVSMSWRGLPELVDKANGSVTRLMELLVHNFPSFGDEAWYAGRQVGFYKRAQILVGDLHLALNGRSFGRFNDLDNLTAFADYKLPQLLRYEGVLSYSDQLAKAVDEKQWIERSSVFEVEIRAATITAVEMLKKVLARNGRALLSMEIDWLLWQLSQEKEMLPHHRTLTTAY